MFSSRKVLEEKKEVGILKLFLILFVTFGSNNYMVHLLLLDGLI